uniref:NADH-ubiquinone oxidoreductase chain 2 n=1 Tax=Osmoderma opicum TaxID=1884344 RepID=A0A1B2ALA7_9SCAR|nr:NADH dehydrogenase subunit 2 [Osmoderma opicum]ANY27991.1 NADH dehydrogenase subunit 2 [Osmoderma caeleste]
MWIYYKILFITSLMIGTMISISSYSWMGMWMGLEINLLSFIPLMTDAKNKMATEAALKYFIVQAMASTFLLFSIIILSLNFSYNLNFNMYFSLIFNTSLLTKMGAAPFHFWFPEVMDGLNWTNSAILLIWQKIAPMALIMYSNQTTVYFIIVIILSMLISGLMGMNQTSLRKILAYSSINHIGWMLSTILIMETVWLYYFTIYTIINLNIVIMFKKLNIFYVNQLYISLNQNPMIKFFFMLNFLSLGGLPPFLGFFPKWLVINSLIQSNFYFLTLLMTVMTLLTLYFYLRITFSTILISSNEMNFHHQRKINKFLMFTLSLVTLASLILSTLAFNFM